MNTANYDIRESNMEDDSRDKKKTQNSTKVYGKKNDWYQANTESEPQEDTRKNKS